MTVHTAKQCNKKYDLLAIDDAFVDEFYSCSPEHILAHGVKVGDTEIHPSEFADTIAKNLKHELRMSGGGSANAAVHMQQHGAKTAFSGLVGTGTQADLFREDLKNAGVDLYELPTDSPNATGRCMVLVNPDAQRTMITSLPLTTSITPQEVDHLPLKDAKIVFTQAYRWAPATRDAFLHAFKVARASGGKAAFCLSAPFCVARAREDFLKLLDGKIDILFGNEHEFEALFPGKDIGEIKTILKNITISGKCGTIAFTQGSKGSTIFQDGHTHEIPAVEVAHVVDTTGAGDAYAAGVMHGIAQGLYITEAGQMGAEWAAEVIQHYGARKPCVPQQTLEKVGTHTPPNAQLSPMLSSI